jgi:hypothetical protein
MRLLALLTPVILASCVQPTLVPIEPIVGVEMIKTCGAADLQDLVGRSAKVLETMRFGSEVRIIRPGMAVTMDYREDRLNIEIDDKETIARVACG